MRQYPKWDSAQKQGLTKDQLWDHIDHLCLNSLSGPVALEMLEVGFDSWPDDTIVYVQEAVKCWSMEGGTPLQPIMHLL